MIHLQASPLAGNTLKLKDGKQFQPGQQVTIVDWWDRVSGSSWKESGTKGVAGVYAWRAGEAVGLHFKEGDQYFIPPDDEVLFGIINNTAALVNICELELPENAQSNDP